MFDTHLLLRSFTPLWLYFKRKRDFKLCIEMKIARLLHVFINTSDKQSGA